MSFDVHSSNPVVKAVIEGTAPRPARLAASRGILPLPQADLLEVLASLALGSDAELAANARTALREQASDMIEPILRSPEAAPATLAYFASADDMPESIYEAVVTNAVTEPVTVAELARKTRSGPLLELISLNQQLLIREPAIIDAIIENPHRTGEAERRAAETRREFFEKERGAQQIANELRAQGRDAAAEFLESAEFASEPNEGGLSAEDMAALAAHIEVLDRETDDSWLGLEFIEEIYEESEEQRRAVFEKILGEISSEDEDDVAAERISMLNRIIKMGVKDRVKLGMKGDREARNILIRDPNKLVSSAVINNPRITEQEVERISQMKSVSEDILRQIAMNRQWGRVYNIQLNLAKNPRTPIGNSMSIMNRLQLRDLLGLQKDRNVPEAVRRHALRLVNARTGRK
ncbi:MAG: hypothetical protein KF736_01970 [Acidobacteria bacterium]|nr:hypothetical protein [Acidobacteriota bacterium]MCW5948245.1 hypothetical protein [Pyrinomonadaceae bacterium]